MPEYLAPGVYVEEVSYRAASIEGVSTTTTGFVGPTRFGPVDGELEVLTSLGDFERTYGDGQELVFSDLGIPIPNFMWQAARVFFDQGGQRLYVKRVFRPSADDDAGTAAGTLGAIGMSARFPGAAAAGTVQFTVTAGPNVLGRDAASKVVLNGVQANDVVWIRQGWAGSPPDAPPLSPPHPALNGGYYIASPSNDASTGGWTFTDSSGSPVPALTLAMLNGDAPPQWRDEVRVMTVSVTYAQDSGAPSTAWSGLPLDPAHQTGGADDSVFAIFAPVPPSRALQRTIPLALTVPPDVVYTGLDLMAALDAANPDQSPRLAAAAADPNSAPVLRSVQIRIDDGDDGAVPAARDYQGEDIDIEDKTGLKAFEDIAEVAIVAAPGSTYRYEYGGPLHQAEVAATIQALIAHVEKMRYRIAVLDCGDQEGISDVSELRGTIDSTYAALYYPWVTVLDPITNVELNLPPSGFVAGIYARNDIENAVFKAPANEVVTDAIGFEKLINTAQQEVLNPLGVNCFRFFEGRGYRLWGARTATSDSEWMYVNLRRYFAYLEHSIDNGTQWAVFEPNGELLWAKVRRTISDFLFSEFQSGALLGDTPQAAYFVRCDQSTMTQNDLDNGRLVCQIGVAALRPAEFVIFRIGQWTADATS